MEALPDSAAFPGDCKYDPCADCPIQKLPPWQVNHAAEVVEPTRRYAELAIDIGDTMTSPRYNGNVRDRVGDKTRLQEIVAIMDAVARKNTGQCLVDDTFDK